MKTVYRLVLCLLIPFHFGCAQSGGSSIPEKTDYGRLFIDAVNSDSDSQRKDIIRHIFSESAQSGTGQNRLLDLVKHMHDNFAPLEFHHSEIAEFHGRPGMSDVLHIYARKKGATMWTDIQFRVDPPPSHKLTSLGFIAEVAEPVYLPNGSIQHKETLAWLDKYIDKLHRDNALYGSITIAIGGTVQYAKHFGFSDADKKKAIDETTLFNLGSGNKMFTALCIAKLAEQGKLKYDDRVTKYLSGFSDMTKADKITIHHMLSHTSGLGEYWAGQNNEAMKKFTTINEHLSLVYQAGFQFDPGSEYGYCNSNYIVLGAIIEKVTGMDYYEFVDQTIYKPSGMSLSGSFTYGDKTKNLAIPLSRSDKNEWIEAQHGTRGSAAGGGYSNAHDILLFSKALKNHVIVKAETFSNMIADKTTGLKDAEGYGYGFILSKSGGQKAYGHGGTSKGVNFEFRYFPAEDITLVVFCNQDNGAYDDLKRNAIKLISGER